MAARSKISSAPNGENTSLAGTEAVPVSGSKYTLISTIAAYIRTLTQTLTNKTIDLTSNTLTGTTAQFNTALSDGNFADTAAEYITSAANSSLSAEVVIPGLAGSADRAGIGGAGVSHEFDSGASPLTWSAAVDTETVDSTIPSHLYIQDNGATETLGTYNWSPAGAFDIRCKLSIGAEVGTSASGPAAGLVVGDVTLANRLLIIILYDGATDKYVLDAYTYTASTYTQRGARNQIGINSIYLRFVRDGSNNCSFYHSFDGLTWLLVATQSFTFTCAKAGIRVAAASLTTNVAVDWIRSDV
jgi:hypothetical protein